MQRLSAGETTQLLLQSLDPFGGEADDSDGQVASPVSDAAQVQGSRPKRSPLVGVMVDADCGTEGSSSPDASPMSARSTRSEAIRRLTKQASQVAIGVSLPLSEGTGGGVGASPTNNSVARGHAPSPQGDSPPPAPAGAANGGPGAAPQGQHAPGGPSAGGSPPTSRCDLSIDCAASPAASVASKASSRARARWIRAATFNKGVRAFAETQVVKRAVATAPNDTAASPIVVPPTPLSASPFDAMAHPPATSPAGALNLTAGESPTGRRASAKVAPLHTPLLTADELQANISREEMADDLERLMNAVFKLTDDLNAWRSETAALSPDATEAGAVLIALRHLARQMEGAAGLVRLQQTISKNLIAMASDLEANFPPGDRVAGALREEINAVQRHAPATAAAAAATTPVRRAGSVEDGYTDRAYTPQQRLEQAVPTVTVTDSGDLAVSLESLLQALNDNRREGAGSGSPGAARSLGLHGDGKALIAALIDQRAGLVAEVGRLTKGVERIRENEGTLRSQHQERTKQMMDEIAELRAANDALKSQQAKNREKAETYIKTFEEYRGQMNVIRGHVAELTKENYELRRGGLGAGVLALPPPPPSVAQPQSAQRVITAVAAGGRGKDAGGGGDTAPARGAGDEMSEDTDVRQRHPRGGSPAAKVSHQQQRGDVAVPPPPTRPPRVFSAVQVPTAQPQPCLDTLDIILSPSPVADTTGRRGPVPSSISPYTPTPPVPVVAASLLPPPDAAAVTVPVPTLHAPPPWGGIAGVRDSSTDPEFDVLSTQIVSKIERIGMRLTSPDVLAVEPMSPDFTVQSTPQRTRSVSPSRYLSETPHQIPPAYSPSLSLQHTSYFRGRQ